MSVSAARFPVDSPGAPLDTDKIRRDFPVLSETVDGRPLIYLDNAATSQKPAAVIDAVAGYYRTANANVHRGVHELARRATEGYEGARERVADWIGAEGPEEIVWTRGTTEAINLVANALGSRLQAGDEILLSDMEHHSNIVPWQLLAERVGAELRYVELDAAGRLDMETLSAALGDRTRIVALSHVSNALGTINPVRQIVDEVRARCDAQIVIDGAQAVPHLPVDVVALGCDAYAFSGHKMLAPTGVGCLWMRADLLESLPPWQGGGEMIREVHRDRSTWTRIPHKFEAGTPNIAGAFGMAAAVDYLEAVGMEAVRAHEVTLLARALDGLDAVPGLRIFGPPAADERSGVVSFMVEGADAQDLATLLDAQGIAVRAGHHCAQLVMKRYGITSTVRASVYLYNTEEEIDRLCAAVASARQMLVG